MQRTMKAVCQVCGKEYEGRWKRVVSGQSKACSVDCQRKLPRTFKNMPDQSGDKNHNWKGGISKHAIRYTGPWKRVNPEKYEVHRLVANAKRRGDLQPEPCEKCGATARIQAHHDDYSQPWNIRWLCVKCHVEFHHLGKHRNTKDAR